jgi:hypothetical protein
MRLRQYIFAAFAVSLVATRAFTQAAEPDRRADRTIRINQIQVIGSHNSYHAGLLPGIVKVLEQRDPKELAGLDYAHAGLDKQLNGGVRQIELDIFADSKGGRFAHPKGQMVVAQAGLPTDPDPYPEGVMLKPGFKVMHMQDLDYASNCQPFVACLQIVRSWSKAHPEHVPIFILVETKQHLPDNKNPWTEVEPFTAETLDALDAEIRSVFPADEMITPDKMRGHHRTLEKAVQQGGWPTLERARGKVVFLMDQTDVGPLYLKGHPALRGRVIFTNATPGQPDAAFIEKNEGDEVTIAALVRRGYLVRTRADSETVEARNNDGSRRDRALRSGAQIVSTDYPQSEPARWTGYYVALPNGVPARCNPVNGPSGCVDSLLEAVQKR